MSSTDSRASLSNSSRVRLKIRQIAKTLGGRHGVAYPKSPIAASGRGRYTVISNARQNNLEWATLPPLITLPARSPLIPLPMPPSKIANSHLPY